MQRSASHSLWGLSDLLSPEGALTAEASIFAIVNYQLSIHVKLQIRSSNGKVFQLLEKLGI
jgi:hypothetical protein